MRWLLLLFVVVPLTELYLLLAIGSQIGFWPTLWIVLVTGVLGASLAQREGLRVFDNYRQALSQGRMPAEGIVGGMLVLVGGVLLVAPGVLTDLTGLFLLFPPTRRFVAARIQRMLASKLDEGVLQVMTAPVGPPGPRGSVHVVDTEGVEVQATHLLEPATRSKQDPD
ncbi:MAG: FxsA family protein [Polyangiaceae bacterium]|nr:FxsA family protein [Polyangiaceae bacterium]